MNALELHHRPHSLAGCTRGSYPINDGPLASPSPRQSRTRIYDGDGLCLNPPEGMFVNILALL